MSVRLGWCNFGRMENEFFLTPTLTIYWLSYNEIALRWGYWEFAISWWKSPGQIHRMNARHKDVA